MAKAAQSRGERAADRILTELTPTKYGFSLQHDRALDLCKSSYPTCPFGCAKDGAPNCAHNVHEARCEPGKRVLHLFPSKGAA